MPNNIGFFARRKWNKAQAKVNDAVNTFSKYGLGYSVSDGVIGNTSSLTKREMKSVDSAGAIMKKNSASCI